MIKFGKELVRDEARALDALAESLGEEFERACRLILDAKGKVGSSRVDLQACKLEYSIVSPK